ncbi:MAG: sporulation protein [Ectobacillus sp.]
MFKKFLARFGKGAATVDLRFENRPYRAGDTVQGEVMIQGGEVEQQINHLAARLMMNVATRKGTIAREVAAIPLSGAYKILPKEQKIIPFTYIIPANLPVSRGMVSYHFDTHLDIEGGVDRTDVDRLVVELSKEAESVCNALVHLGFREKPTSGKVDHYGQEFAFFPTGMFMGQVNEVELRFAIENGGVRVWMEIDCRRGFHEIEAKREFFLNQSVLQDEQKTAELLQQYITEALVNPHAYAQPFSYVSHKSGHHHGSPLASMVGGLAVGILGGMLLDEILDELGVDEMMEDAAEALGLDEEAFGEAEESGFGDFFGGGDEDF